MNPDGQAVRLSEVVDESGTRFLDFLEGLPAEQKRLSRVYLYERAGLPIPPEDLQPIN
jgi:hypothetical protein